MPGGTTTGQLADELEVHVRTVRRWHREGLIRPELYSKTLRIVIIDPNGTATDGVYLSCDAGDRFVRVEDVKASPKLISYSATPLAIISDAIVRVTAKTGMYDQATVTTKFVCADIASPQHVSA